MSVSQDIAFDIIRTSTFTHSSSHNIYMGYTPPSHGKEIIAKSYQLLHIGMYCFLVVVTKYYKLSYLKTDLSSVFWKS